MRKCLMVFVFVALVTGPHRAAGKTDLALRGISALDQKIASLGHRLAVANIEICEEKSHLPGFSLHHLSQYSGEYRKLAAKLFGLDVESRVLAIAKGSPAEAAGLKLGDPVFSADGQDLFGSATNMESTTGILERIQTRLDEAFADGHAVIEVERNGQKLTIQIEAETGCASRFYLEPSSDPNARSDGMNIVVTTAIAAFVADDAELAAVLAHELAHNILGHKARLDEEGRASSNVRRTEREADRLSVHLLQEAKFDPNAAVRFWRRFGPKRVRLFSGSHHPHWRQRIKAISAEIRSAGTDTEIRTRSAE